MGAAIPKQYLEIADKPLIQWTLEKLDKLGCIERIVIALSPDDNWFESISLNIRTPLETVLGGQERYNSVLNALDELAHQAKDSDWVLVHDAVRPCFAVKDVTRLIQQLEDSQAGGILASRVKDTLKYSGDGKHVSETLDRGNCWLAHTPQMFRFGILRDAMQKAASWPDKITDEASAAEMAGYPVCLVEGLPDNIKITDTSDLRLAEYLLTQESLD